MFQIFIVFIYNFHKNCQFSIPPCKITCKLKTFGAGPKPLFGDGKKGIIVLHEDTIVYICRRAVPLTGDCVYGLCLDCFSKKYSSNRRGGPVGDKEKKSPLEISRNTCCHNPQDLKDEKNLWWCKPDYIGSETWFSRCHGCFSCEKMFVLVGKKGLPSDYEYPHFTTFAKSVCEKYVEWNKVNAKLDF